MATYRSDMAKSRTCVYRAYLEDGALAYVGMTRNPRGRFSKHSCQKPWWRACEVVVEWFPDRLTAQREERRVIAEEFPLYNMQDW